MTVFPENMNLLPEKEKEAIKVLESYIRYMRERIEFSVNSLTKIISGDGITTAEVIVALNDLASEVSRLSSSLSSLSGAVTAMSSQVTTNTNNITTLQGNVTALQSALPITSEEAPTESTPGTIGQLLIVNGTDTYICTSANENVYTWKQF